MDRQAEFEIGICPLGGLRFDKIRADFLLDEEDELVHSFICGSYIQTMPRNWKYLSAEKNAMAGHKNSPLPASLAVHEQHATPNNQYPSPCDIAIVGISGRYPGANNLAEFWDNLKSGKQSFTEQCFNQASDYRTGPSSVDSSSIKNDKPLPFQHRAAFFHSLGICNSFCIRIGLHLGHDDLDDMLMFRRQTF